MAATFVDYKGNQGTGTNNADFGFSFPSFQKQDVKVEVDNDIKTLDTHYQINTYNVVSGGTVTFTAGNIPSLATQDIRIYRETDVATNSGDADPKAEFQAGSSIKAGDLNDNFKQALFAAREQQEQTVQTHEIKDSAVTAPKVKDGSVTTDKIANGAVTSAKIGNAQVDSQHFAANSIDTIHYAPLSVNNSALGVDAVNGNKIADNSIDSEHYVNGSINTEHIGNAQITHDKLGADCIDGDNIQDNVINSEHYAHGSIDTEHIANQNVTTAKLENDAVTSAKLADNAVLTANVTDLNITTAKIANNAVTESKIGANAVTTGKIAAYNVDTINIANNAITHVKLANDSVDGDNIQDNSINSEHYVNGSIDTAHIADGNITTGKLASDAVTGAKIADDAINSEHYVDGSIDTAHIADDAVTNAKISTAAVSTTELTDSSVTVAKLATDAVTTAKIQDTAVTTAKIANDNITTAKIADDAVTNAKIADGTLDGRYYTEAELDAGQLDNRYFTEAESDARYFNISSGDTIKDGDTFPDNDTTIATTAAINDRIIDLVDDVGGFVPIANETSFPTANPDVNNGAGTIVSVKAASTSLTAQSGTTLTIANGAGTGNTVTITGLSVTIPSGFGFLVETSSTLHTYAFHRLVPKATEVTTVAGSISNVNTVAGSISNVNSVASNATNINTVAGINANVTTVAGISGNVTTVANNNANVTAVAGKATEITRLGTADAVADLAILGTTDAVADMNTLATTAIVSDMDTLADISSNITTVAGISSNVTTVANNNSNVTAVADNASNINSVASNASNINSAVSNASNINSAVSNASNINSAVSNASNINTVAGSISNVNTAATNIASINTTASNIADVNNFTDRYQVASSDPSTDGGGNALAAGDLYFNTSADELKVYTGSAWQGGVTATGNFAVTTGNTFTGTNIHNDNVKSVYGTNSDGLEIYHDGSHSVIKDNGTGTLKLLTSTLVVKNAADNTTTASFIPATEVGLFYAGSKKFKTTNTGIDVTGNITLTGNVDGRDVSADGTKLDGIETGATADQTASDIKTLFNSSGLVNAQIAANAAIAGSKIDPTFTSDTTVETSGNPTIKIHDTSGDNQCRVHYETDSFNWVAGLHGGVNTYKISKNNTFGTNDYFQIDGTGTVDIAGNLNVGSGVDVTGSITASSTGNASLILDAGTGSAGGNQISFIDFKLDGTVKSNIAINEGVSGIPLELNSASGTGAVHLFHSGSKKFETSSGGASVSGDLSISGNASVGDLIQIGDDVKIEDYNVANTFRVKGVQDGSQGFIAFGDQSKKLGVADDNADLTYDGNEVLTSASSLNASNISSGTVNTARLPNTYTKAAKVTIQATGAGNDVHLDAADHIILESGEEEDGNIYFRGNGGTDSYRFAKSGQTAIEGFLSFQSLSTDRTYTFPDTTGTLALTSSDITGNAATATTATNVVGVANSSNTAYRVPFLSANTGTAAVYTDTNNGIRYNPSTNTLAAGNFSGDGSSVTNVNATTLDSIDSGSFLRSDADDVASRRIRFSNNQTDNMDTIATSSSSHGCIEIYNQGVGNDAFMAFHTGSDFAFYFGLDADSNKLAVGGWSMGANKYAIYHEGNNPSYNDLSNKPTIPTNNNQLSNGAGYITSVSGQNYNSLSNKPTIPTNNNQLSNGAGYLTSGSDRACQAWVNFRGTSSVTRRDHVNVNSVNDNGVGLYTVNFQTSMPNSDYCIATGFITSQGNANCAKVVSQSTGSFQIRTGSFQDGSGNNNRDFEAVYCAIFAD